MTPTEQGIEIASLQQSLKEAETNAQTEMRNARDLIEELAQIIEAARREGSYVYQTARWARAKKRAEQLIGGAL